MSKYKSIYQNLIEKLDEVSTCIGSETFNDFIERKRVAEFKSINDNYNERINDSYNKLVGAHHDDAIIRHADYVKKLNYERTVEITNINAKYDDVKAILKRL